MKIGIIGAGQIGSTLTRRLTALGHEVLVANSRGPETLSDLASETGATAVSAPEAVRGVDLVVVTIPEKNILSLPAGLFADTPDHVVVVDTGIHALRRRRDRMHPRHLQLHLQNPWALPRPLRDDPCPGYLDSGAPC